MTATPITTCTIDTPDGPFTLVTRPDGAVLASGWTDDTASLIALIHPTLRPTEVSNVHDDDPAVVHGIAAVRRYYAGDITAPDQIAVVQASGPFREAAWEALRGVEAGAPVTYTEYAERSGRPAAVRAAAGACAMNAAALFVPCHRVLRSDGSLGGFRYGLAIKESLLARESAATTSTTAE